MDQSQFISELAKLRSNSTFLTLNKYRNEHSEVANYSIVFHISYQNALNKSIMILNQYLPLNDLEVQAKNELLESFQNSLNKMEENSIEDIEDGYTRFYDSDGKYIKGVKMHTETGTLHLYGLVSQKKILIPGLYQKKNKRPLTLAKDKLRYSTPVGKFRQFRILPNQVDSIVVESLHLLPPENE